MKKSILLSLLFFTVSLSPLEHPVEFSVLKKSGETYILRIDLPEKFGIQREAPNRILLSGEDGLTISKADLKFRGLPNQKKPEYFSRVEDMILTLKGKGNLKISAKIYYCDFTKNICIPGQVEKVVKIN